MKTKVYTIVLVILSALLGAAVSVADSYRRQYVELKSQEDIDIEAKELGYAIENWIYDVVCETDLFEEVSDDEQKYLEYISEEWYPRYCIELILLYQKYYGTARIAD